MERAVSVRYSKTGKGWSYVVLAADSLTFLGEGWSAGRKRDAENAFRQSARERGWVTAEIRAERMRGAA